MSSVDVTVSDFNQLDRAALRGLLPLTNSPQRGDHRDGDPTRCGSGLRRILQDRLRGYVHPNRAWAIVARDGTGPVAWCLVTELTCDPDTNEVLSVPVASVGIYVAPDHRRQGWGTRLLKEASDLARKIGSRRLLASPWNVTSNSFYRSSGFNELRPYFTGWTVGTAVLPIL